MTFIYADSGLVGQLGHHANSARVIVGELRRRGIETRVLAHQHVHPDLVDELDAEPWFRVNTYAVLDDDPICGWMMGHYINAEVTAVDLNKIKGDFGDVVYFNSAQVVQLAAVGRMLAINYSWSKMLRPVIEFGVDPGVEVKSSNDDGPTELGIPDPRQDARATMYRYTALTLGERVLSRLSLNTFEPWSSKAYAAILGTDVGVLPVPRGARGAIRNRSME